MRRRWGWLLAALALAACARQPLGGMSGLSTEGASPGPAAAVTNPPAVGPLPVPIVGPLGPIVSPVRPSAPVVSATPIVAVGLGATVILVVPVAPSPSPSGP
jgi:hypothetical protein